MHTGFYALSRPRLVYELRFAPEAKSTQMYGLMTPHNAIRFLSKRH